MQPNTLNILLIFETILVSLLLSILLAKMAIAAANKIGLIDQPGSALHKRHDKPVPIAGGAALFFAILIAVQLLNGFRYDELRITFIAALPVFLFGMWDDFKPISPLLKLTGQGLSAVLLIYQGIHIQVFETIAEVFFYPDSPVYTYLDWALTLLWLVGISNAFNFVDSMDGLAVGIGAMAASFFMLVALDSNQFWLAQFSSILIGTCIGLYFFNAHPAILFLGDSGAQLLGFLLAVVGILYAPQGVEQTSTWFVPILLLSVPIFDASLVIVSRLRRKRPIYTAALDHTYHRLLRFGMHPNRAVLMMHVVSLALGCLAFICLVQTPIVANAIFFFVVVLGTGLLLFLDRRAYWV